MQKLSFAEYIWLDGGQPIQGIRSKTRVVQVPDAAKPIHFPAWSFDGSSTEQASRIGDAAWFRLLDAHNLLFREELPSDDTLQE